MGNRKGTMELVLGSWLVAFAVATIAGSMLWFLGGWGFLQACFIGALVFVIFGAVFSWVMMQPLPGPNEVNLTTPAAPKGVAPKAPASKPAPKPAAAPAAAASAPVAAEPKKATPAPKKPAADAPAAPAEERPDLMLDAPQGGQADDLKKISGVGPKLEQTLNELGIWHYEQVARLKKKDIAWVDERLRFKGRIERDDWVGQAKALAKAED